MPRQNVVKAERGLADVGSATACSLALEEGEIREEGEEE